MAANMETSHPIIAGIPCKKRTPQVSLKDIFSFKNGAIFKKPIAEIAPVKNPTRILGYTSSIISHAAPIATPPDKVAFKTTSGSNFPFSKNLQTLIAPTTLQEIEIKVFTIALY